jgi:hypothetical protein
MAIPHYQSEEMKKHLWNVFEKDIIMNTKDENKRRMNY